MHDMAKPSTGLSLKYFSHAIKSLINKNNYIKINFMIQKIKQY